MIPSALRNPLQHPDLAEDDMSLFERTLLDQQTETDMALAARMNLSPKSKADIVAETMGWFFSDIGPGVGQCYETNAWADAVSPTLECAKALKVFLGKAAGFRELAPYRSKGSPFKCRGQVVRRNVWSSPEIAAARNAGDTSYSPVTARPTKAQRREPVVDTSVIGDILRRLEALEKKTANL
jgi:hypothetical protein